MGFKNYLTIKFHVCRFFYSYLSLSQNPIYLLKNLLFSSYSLSSFWCRVDNIKGVKGIGIKTAQKLIKFFSLISFFSNSKLIQFFQFDHFYSINTSIHTYTIKNSFFKPIPFFTKINSEFGTLDGLYENISKVETLKSKLRFLINFMVVVIWSLQYMMFGLVMYLIFSFFSIIENLEEQREFNLY